MMEAQKATVISQKALDSNEDTNHNTDIHPDPGEVTDAYDTRGNDLCIFNMQN
jgi:hypothetical protein